MGVEPGSLPLPRATKQGASMHASLACLVSTQCHHTMLVMQWKWSACHMMWWACGAASPDPRRVQCGPCFVFGESVSFRGCCCECMT